MLLYDSLKFSFVYQRAICLILRLPQVNKNVLKSQIVIISCGPYLFSMISESFYQLPVKLLLRKNKETLYRQNWFVDLVLNLSASQFSFPVQMLIFRSPCARDCRLALVDNFKLWTKQGIFLIFPPSPKKMHVSIFLKDDDVVYCDNAKWSGNLWKKQSSVRP